jgi:hypothetical protein
MGQPNQQCLPGEKELVASLQVEAGDLAETTFNKSTARTALLARGSSFGGDTFKEKKDTKISISGSAGSPRTESFCARNGLCMFVGGFGGTIATLLVWAAIQGSEYNEDHHA